ncbi:hypothetical protein DQM24_06030 [Lacticaseibacillus paracasei]|nr:hypothetical protein DQM24_06030 [Lacticaseibacillus paracasei]
MTLRWSLGSRSLRAGFCFCLRVSESQQRFSTRGHCLASRALTRQFLRLFARLKEPRIFYLQIPYTKIPVIITTTF